LLCYLRITSAGGIQIIAFLKELASPTDYSPISDENHFFHQILLRLSEKLPFGYFGIPLFSFFKILTLNQNINSESFRVFLTVHRNFSGIFLHRKNSFGLLNPNPLEFLRYLFPFSSYKQIHFQFFNSARITVRNFFWPKKCFYDIKICRI
jgi:hypothetical protein